MNTFQTNSKRFPKNGNHLDYGSSGQKEHKVDQLNWPAWFMFIEAYNDVSLEIPFAYKPYTANKFPTGMGWFVEQYNYSTWFSAFQHKGHTYMNEVRHPLIFPTRLYWE
jgi:hypothetical protein